MKKDQYIDMIIFCRKWQKENRAVFVDILNAEFVDDFAKEFDFPIRIMNYGANKCPALNKFLSQSAKDGYSERGRVGITNRMWGVPSWVYVYNFNFSPAG